MLFSLGLTFFKADLLSEFKFIGLDNYITLVKDSLFHKSLIVTSYYTFVTVPLGLVVGLTIALGLNEKIPLQSIWRTFYYLPSVVSGIAVAILWRWVFNPRFGLLNYGLSLLGIAGPAWLFDPNTALLAIIITSVWKDIGFVGVMYLGGLQSNGSDLRASRWATAQTGHQLPRNVKIKITVTGARLDVSPLWPLVEASDNNPISLGLNGPLEGKAVSLTASSIKGPGAGAA